MSTLVKITTLTVMISVLTVTNTLHAQNVTYGVKAGMDLSNLGGKDAEDMDLDINPGFHLGGFIETPVSAMLDLESGLYLSTKGFKSSMDIDDVNLKFTSTSYYLDLPVLAKYSFNQGFNAFAGPQLSYLINSRETWEFDGDKESEWDIEGLNRFDLGLVAGTGYNFKNGLSVNANYDLGLSKLGKDDDSNVYNRVLKVSMGYRFYKLI